MTHLLEIENLTVSIRSRLGTFDAVRGLSLKLRPGEILSIVGESGCGKTTVALSILGLLPSIARISAGKILLQGEDLLQLSPKQMLSIRGSQIALIFQEPATALNPLMKIGDQVAEGLVVHAKMRRKEAWDRAVQLLKLVRIADPDNRAFDYPHQLSGGMRQRVMIAMAIACGPKLLIADEPTTALDVTIQAEILQLLKSLRDDSGMSIVLITHDFGVVAEVADRVAVMYAGQIVEAAEVRELFRNPCHPYTQGLLDSIPSTSSQDALPTRLKSIEGTVPDMLMLPPGCSFYERCNIRMDCCIPSFPDEMEISSGHIVSCYRYGSP